MESMKKQYELYDEYDEFKHLTRIYRVNVEVDLELLNSIVAAINPLQHPDGSEDILAVDEYENFIINALGIFSVHDFEVIDEHDSPFSHSYYCTLVKRDQLETLDYKYILFIRLSDHTNRKQVKHYTKQYYDRKAQEMKQPPTKRRQTWKLKEITVNKDTFASYDDALDYLDNILP